MARCSVQALEASEEEPEEVPCALLGGVGSKLLAFAGLAGGPS